MEEPKSKSEKKRLAEEQKQLGVKLIDLNADELACLPLPAQLKQAVLDAKSLRSHGAMRRHAQWIGKLMRAADYDAIAHAYDTLEAGKKAQTAVFHEIEQWRTRLLAEGKPALTEFVETHQPQDVQQLRQLIKKAVDEQQKQTNTGASKALFRYLRSCLL